MSDASKLGPLTRQDNLNVVETYLCIFRSSVDGSLLPGHSICLNTSTQISNILLSSAAAESMTRGVVPAYFLSILSRHSSSD
jgi:hypothetical protein